MYTAKADLLLAEHPTTERKNMSWLFEQLLNSELDRAVVILRNTPQHKRLANLEMLVASKIRQRPQNYPAPIRHREPSPLRRRRYSLREPTPTPSPTSSSYSTRPTGSTRREKAQAAVILILVLVIVVLLTRLSSPRSISEISHSAKDSIDSVLISGVDGLNSRMRGAFSHMDDVKAKVEEVVPSYANPKVIQDQLADALRRKRHCEELLEEYYPMKPGPERDAKEAKLEQLKKKGYCKTIYVPSS
ncbi:hypothetical protein B0J12DRAFT_738745 [Macrophomina phaseolina]|uniref:Uncharacterized protein n=1 Tax=Macrophomina phaseolina TaxID=35725 RepID=A0ABQ8GFM1_9PEZI|nr:hypothetical protein B0J12DRAFT_738745 [Macrophomina phaseolina]